MQVTKNVAGKAMGDHLRASPACILLVEDDSGLREALRGDLMDRGFLVQDFPGGAALLQALDQHTEADIIVLDWNMPGLSGIEVLSKLRERGVTLPVVFLTGYNQVAREMLAFESGAFDFIGKERGVDVLVRRLRVVLGTSKLGLTDQRPDKLRLWQAGSRPAGMSGLLGRSRCRADCGRI